MEQKEVYLNDFQSFFGKFMDKIIGFLPSLIGAIIVLFVGVWICLTGVSVQLCWWYHAPNTQAFPHR